MDDRPDSVVRDHTEARDVGVGEIDEDGRGLGTAVGSATSEGFCEDTRRGVEHDFLGRERASDPYRTTRHSRP